MTDWGGKRENAGRKHAGNVQVTVRMTPEQRETLKALGGSEWLQNQIDSNKSFAGRRLVIEYDFGKVYFATDDEIGQLKNDFGDVQWDECGPYLCDTFKDAVSLIADQIECETIRDKPDIDKIETLNNVLKEITNLM